MSGEAAIHHGSKRFRLSFLSGEPVWDAAAAAPIERRLREAFEPRRARVEALVEAAAVELSLEEFVDAPGVAGAPLDDRRERVHMSARDPASGRGFNLVLQVSARVRRERFEALAKAIGEVLLPGAVLQLR